MELAHAQKQVICEIAREAYDAWPAREEFDRAHANPSLDAFTAWRHAEQLKAVGRQSLTLCTDTDYTDLRHHFMQLRTEHMVAANNLSFFFQP